MLVDQSRAEWRDRAHFLALAAVAMRDTPLMAAGASLWDSRRVLLPARWAFTLLGEARPEAPPPPSGFPPFPRRTNVFDRQPGDHGGEPIRLRHGS